MASLRDIQTRIKSVVSTQQITKAMKMVSAAKLRRAQDSIIELRPYAKKLNGLLVNLSTGLESTVDTPYAVKRELKQVMIVVITSDRGLCGAFNSNVIKTVNKLIADKYADHLKENTLQLTCIGKKGFEYYKKRKFNIKYKYPDFFGTLSYENCMEVCDLLMKDFVKGDFDVIELVFNEFKNVATQNLIVEQFLPVKENEASKDAKTVNTDYLYEPDQATLVAELVPKSLKIQFYKSILESNASEQGARMTAMSQATDNATELLKELRLSYNRARQAKITKELIEIVSGADALN